MEECRQSIRRSEKDIEQLGERARTLDHDMYDHQNMQQAVTNDMRRAEGAVKSCTTTLLIGYTVGVAAAVGCIQQRSVFLGVMSAVSTAVAAWATRTRASALRAQPKQHSMLEGVERNMAATEQARAAVDRWLADQRARLAAQQGQLELLQVASRVSNVPDDSARITQTPSSVQIGELSVPRRTQ